jgi:hypothetical protein
MSYPTPSYFCPWRSTLLDADTDFLNNNGEKLREALTADAESTRKLRDALDIFGEMEDKLKDVIRRDLSLMITTT